MKNEASTLVFFVNGKKVIEEQVNPEWTLLHYLRKKLSLSGTKLACGEGGCGACTVMVSKYDRNANKVIHLPVNACLAPVCAMHGLAVTTVEGIGSTRTRLHPVQERIAKSHGSQCGYCTPGIVMSMYTLLRNSNKPSMKELEVALQGNLCRCTGYRAIIEGYKTFTEDWELMQNAPLLTNGNGTCAMGDQCCKLQNGTKESHEEFPSKHINGFIPYDPTQEPIFPPELKLNDTWDNQSLVFKGTEVTWYRPTNLSQLLELKHLHPGAKIIVGNSEVGVEVKFKHCIYPVLIQPVIIPEMTAITILDEGLKIGAAVTLQKMEDALNGEIKSQPEFKTRIFTKIVNMLHWFAGKQIRNVAAVGGNIMTGSPISDLNPIFIAAKIELELQSKQGLRKVKMDENFFTGYRKCIVREDEILVSLVVPYTKKNQYFCAYKQARRRDDDIAIVNAAINVEFAQDNIIEKIDLAFGGMAPTTVTSPATSKTLVGKLWNEATLEIAYSHLINDLPLSPSAPGGMIQYRKSLTLSFFFRAYMEILQQLQPQKVTDKDSSAIREFHMKIPKSSQYYQISPDHEVGEVGKPVIHTSALKQATGEAIYCDDLPKYSNELYMAFVLSTRAHAKILSVDPSVALEMDGVEAFFSAKDIGQKQNEVGSFIHDEEVFASKMVYTQGQVIGVVLAADQLTAQKAARKVKVEYEDVSPIIITIEDAIKQNSYHLPTKKIIKGDIDAVFKTAPHIIEGEVRNGAQEQFYFETQCTIAVPKGEDCEMEVFCSSQNPSEITKLVAHVLNTDQNRIVTRVKRMGGGFGGKESRAIVVALPAAFAAHKLNRPVRCMLDRDEDMLMTGQRHPFYIKYKTAFDTTGKILGCEVAIYNNCGWSVDLSPMILERAMFHFNNAYRIPSVRVLGYTCKTNLPSNTAFRGFGAPQGMLAGETMIRHIAEYLKRPTEAIMELNMYSEGESTHYNQTLEHCNVRRCWSECLTSSDFYKRKQEIEKFNKENRWKKRGLSAVPTQFGIAFTAIFLNQTGALIHVYTDGSILLTHGGTEMGQGLHTKMIQVASTVLEIPQSKIHINETSTDKVPNTSATAASSGSDLNGMAVMNACQIIKERLRPYKEKNPKGTWENWVLAAYMDRVSLSTTGFYKTPDIGYSFDTNSGKAFNYFTFGASCSEVEIDCLTGDHQVLRTDIVMDLGESLNPAIDIGQVEGGFMQGYGLLTLEEMVYSPTGIVFTRGPGAYKIPAFADIPLEFNVSLLKGAPNPRAVYSSKAVGEPPLFLASSIYFAIREAIKAARRDIGLNETSFQYDAPATCAKIRMACQDALTSKLQGEEMPGKLTPWNVVP